MRLLGLLSFAAIGSLWIGCSDRADRSSSDKAQEPSETVGIVLQGNGPRLQVAVTFLGGVAPEPHIQPIAAVLAKARDACFSGPVAGSVGVRARVEAGKLHVVKPGPGGECLAKSLDGVAIEDSSKYEVHIEVTPSTSTSPAPSPSSSP